MDERLMPKFMGAFALSLVLVFLPLLLSMALPAAALFFRIGTVLGLITWLMGLYGIASGRVK